jgi:hypothetical protein
VATRRQTILIHINNAGPETARQRGARRTVNGRESPRTRRIVVVVVVVIVVVLALAKRANNAAGSTRQTRTATRHHRRNYLALLWEEQRAPVVGVERT